MREQNLQAMLRAVDSIEGWFASDAAVLFVAYNQLLRERGLLADVLEIGVYHGKSAVLIAEFRADGARMVAADLFDALQGFGAEGGAVPMEQAFRDHLRAAHGSLDFLRTIAGSSADLTAADLGTQFSFCHIDGDHSQDGTYHDIGLAYSTSLPGGLIAIDDYFNPLFPGVAEGAFRWSLERA